MKSLVLLTLLALLTLGLGRRGTGGSGAVGTVGVILCSGGSKGAGKNLLSLGGGGHREMESRISFSRLGGEVSVRNLSCKRSGVKANPTWSLPEPTHPSNVTPCSCRWLHQHQRLSQL